MRHRTTPALVAIAGLLLVAWSCNVQPGGKGSEPTAEPNTGASPMAKLKPEGRFNKRARGAASRRRMKPIQPVKLGGPRGSKPHPVPKADNTRRIFDSGDVDGEVDPCG